MPAESEAQRKAAGAALAAKRSGKRPKKGSASESMMSMSEDQLSDFAKARHKEKNKPYKGGR